MTISIIGTGRIGFLLEEDPLRYKPCTHMGAIEYLIKKKSKISWDYLCDINESRLSSAYDFVKSKKNPGIKITHNYKKVIDNKPDILIISTNTESHYDIAMSAIKAKIRRIVIEKPVAIRRKHARKILSAAINNNTHIWVNYERRFHPKYIEIKNLIQSAKYGLPVFFRGWFASPNQSLYPGKSGNEGILLHDTTHLVDLVQFLFGGLKKKFKFDTRTSEKSQIHTILIKTSSGISGEILTTTGSDFFHFELEIIFENARITVGNGFLTVEKTEISQSYKNFKSLSKPIRSDDKIINANQNPFVSLYNNVLGDNFDLISLKDACDNISLLT